MIDKSYETLLKKLDLFIRKYYTNQLLKGAAFFLSIGLAYYLLISLGEYYFYFPKSVRQFFMYSSILLVLGTCYFQIIIPLFKYFRLGTTLTHDQAAKIIGNHFPDVEDKLLNVLQLKGQSGNYSNLALIEASIAQKASEIKTIPFQAAIDYSKNKKYLKYLLPILGIIVGIGLISPQIFIDSNWRILHNKQNFSRPNPFDFVLLNSNLEVTENESYHFKITTKGKIAPSEVNIIIDNYSYQAKTIDKNKYEYVLHNVQKNTNFYLEANGIKSQEYELKVLNKASIKDFYVEIDYPKYIGRSAEKLKSLSNLNIPEGTHLVWTFNMEHTDRLSIKQDDNLPILLKKLSDNQYRYSCFPHKNTDLVLHYKNQQIDGIDSALFQITVQKDKYPSIEVTMENDSTQGTTKYAVGEVSDDYGIRKLNFVYQINNNQKVVKNIPLLGQINDLSRIFKYSFNTDQWSIKSGDEVTYYFEVFDNDPINGNKSTKSSIHNFKKLTTDQLVAQENQNEKDIKKNLNNSVKKAEEIQEELSKLRKSLLQKDKQDWKDKKKIDQLIDKQQELEKMLEKSQEKFKDNIDNQQEFSKPSEKLQKKQERFDELMKDVNNDMKKLLEQIEKLMQEMKKEESLQEMEKAKFDEEKLQKDLERLEELYKELEVEKELNDMLNEMEKLAEELEKQGDKSLDPKEDKEKLIEKQDQLNKEEQKLEEKLKELNDKNDQLENPKKLDDNAPEKLDDIQQDMERSKEELKQDSRNKASKNQKKAAKKMRELKQKMDEQAEAGEEEKLEEDIKTLRQLLENLVTLSYRQEGLENSVNNTNFNTPKYRSIVHDQYTIKEAFTVVEDTLQAIAKRQAQVESFVLGKVSDIKKSLSTGLDYLEDRNISHGLREQRLTMTFLNDLALMLSETMDQMQQSSSQSKPGGGTCKKPGGKGNKGGKPSDKISKSQKKLGEDIKKTLDAMKAGQKAGAKMFAQMAAQQAELRRQLESQQQENQEKGKGKNPLLDQIMDEMNKNEIDLVNKRLDNQLLIRQQLIETKMLEAEKADREQEKDNKRKSETAININHPFPPALEEYLKKKTSQVDNYKTISPELRPYYQTLVKEYYNSLRNQSK